MRFSFFILLILLLLSCRKLVEDEFPDFPPLPVVNSILVADSTIKVHVSLTDGIDTNQLGWVDSEEVALFIDGQFEEILPYSGRGIYTSNTVIESGRTYSCEVTIPGFEVARSTDSIPQPEVVSHISHNSDAGMDEEGVIYPAISFSVSNNLSVDEYFEVKIRTIYNYTVDDASIIYISDPVLLNEGLPMAVFSDELIEDTSYTMTLNYSTNHYSGSDDGPTYMSLRPLLLEVRTISYDYYTYLKQHYLYETGRYPDIVGGVVTPFPLHSNVENGYGIFAGYSCTVSDTIFPEPSHHEY